MDNERPNERTLWSRRLEEPGALPGTGLTDKEAAWDKLYHRLKEARTTNAPQDIARSPARADDTHPDNELETRAETPRRKRTIWLWTAAACLLLIIVPAALLLKDAHKTRGHEPRLIPVAISSGKQRSAPQDKTTPAPTAAIPPQLAGTGGNTGGDKADIHPRPTAKNAAPSHSTPDRSPRPILTRPTLDKLLAHGADTLNLVFAPRPDLSKPVTAAAAAPVRKELRVVHINELEQQQPTQATAKGPRQKPGRLRIGLAPQETLRPSTTYAEPEAHSILSLHHSQNP